MLALLLRALIRSYCHHSPWDRGKSRLIQWAFLHLQTSPLTATVQFGAGLKLELDLHEYIQSEIYYAGFYERHLAREWRRLVRRSQVIADVGANVGQYSLLAAVAGASVYAFEPNPDIHRLLRRNVEMNRLAHVTCAPYAVADQSGQTTLYLPSDCNAGTASLRQTRSEQVAVTTPTTTLDEYFAEEQKWPDLVKVDIEGAELLAFQGSRRLLTEVRPLLIFEVAEETSRRFGYAPHDLLAYLAHFGYRFFEMTRDGWRATNSHAAPVFANVLGLPSDQEDSSVFERHGVGRS